MVVKRLSLKAEMSELRALKKRLFAGADVVRLIKRQGLGTHNRRDLGYRIDKMGRIYRSENPVNPVLLSIL